MKKIENMIIIGSTGKNVGKTSLVSRIIRAYSQTEVIFAIKITPVDSENTNEIDCDKGFRIIEEKCFDCDTDTSKFLRAGAKRSFWVRTTEENILRAIDEILDITPCNSIIICESTTLAKYVSCGLFILLESKSSSNNKSVAREVRKYADIIVKI